MMYSRFLFGDFKEKSTRDKLIHPYGKFVDPLGSNPHSELAWMSKLRINKAKMVSKEEDDASIHSSCTTTCVGLSKCRSDIS